MEENARGIKKTSGGYMKKPGKAARYECTGPYHAQRVGGGG